MYVRKGQRQLALRPPQGCKQVSGESILAQCRAMGSMPGRGLWDTGPPVPKGFKERAALGVRKVAYLACGGGAWPMAGPGGAQVHPAEFSSPSRPLGPDGELGMSTPCRVLVTPWPWPLWPPLSPHPRPAHRA